MNVAAHKLKWLHAINRHCVFPECFTYKHRFVFKELLLLSTFPSGNSATVTHGRLARSTGFSVSTIKRLLNDCASQGLVSLVRRFQYANEYICHWDGLEGADAVKNYLDSGSSNDDGSEPSEPPDSSLPKADSSNTGSDSSIPIPDSSPVELHRSLGKDRGTNIGRTGDREGVEDVAKVRDVLKIWNSWNDAIGAKRYKGVVPIPQDIQNGVIKGNNALYNAIENWIDEHSDWESLWNQALEIIRTSPHFDGWHSNGKFMHPTLHEMFVPKPVFGRGGNKLPQKEIKVSRVLNGEFSWGKSTHVNDQNTAASMTAQQIQDVTKKSRFKNVLEEV